MNLRFLDRGKSKLRALQARRLTFRTPFLCAIAVFSLITSAAPRQSSLLNKPAPAFTRTSLDNQRIDVSALRGRVVLLNFWATWCGPCQVEMPRFIQWQDRYKADGLSILGVSMDDDSETVS